MIKKLYAIILMIFLTFGLFSCQREEKKPFGAEAINYDKVEGINKDGPIIDENHAENVPPMGDKVNIVEAGPPHFDFPDIVEPTADMDESPDFGGIPVVKKEIVSDGS